MKPGGGGQKGAGFERKVCRSLSLWLTSDKRDDIFWRTAMSGGRATFQRKKGIDNIAQAGDVGGIDPLASKFLNHFVVECKHVRNLDVLAGLLERRGRLWKFWEKLLTETAYREPFLVAKQNRYPVMLFMRPGLSRTVLNHDLTPLFTCWDGGAECFDFSTFLAVPCQL